MGDEFELIRRLNFGHMTEGELLDIYHQHRTSYRMLFHLVKHPSFPERMSLDIIPQLFTVDLIRVVKHGRTKPYVKKRAELEFTNRYQKLPLGEKLSLMRQVPYSILNYFIEEKNPKILLTILNNPFCTEELVMKFLNRKSPRFSLYEAMMDTEWYKRPAISSIILGDREAPVRLLLSIIPCLSISRLQALYRDDNIHGSVRKGIREYLENRPKERQ